MEARGTWTAKQASRANASFVLSLVVSFAKKAPEHHENKTLSPTVDRALAQSSVSRDIPSACRQSSM
ncbi:hypothetical protein CTA1_7027 [Colletotrichum tanaceti]|uniref:Uncharacterized protein n=1 Tax=Colletotrichum tanaceti TaxID=1306861 RepID=A0A4U6X5I2_9PEZI|nr:hypothetical protein CTA1_7027 [Colletotrichum tanaceti]